MTRRVVLLAALLAALALPAGAGAVGELTYDGCFAGTTINGCVNVPGSPLRAARGVAISPDGRSLYVASQDSASVSHFFVQQPGGQLKWDDCVANDATDGCVDVPEAPLEGALDLTVSPDGGSVYVASFFSSTVSRLAAQAPDGRLKWVECLARTAGPCGDIPFPVLNSPRDVTVSPDGGRLYVPSASSDSISPMIVDKPNGGRLLWPGCLADDASQGCGDLPGNPLNAANAAAVSPDGGSLYVVSGVSNSLSRFFIKPGGDLVYDGCLANDAAEGCADVPGNPLTNPAAVAVSPDGGSVYVASADSNTVSHFLVQRPSNQLTWEGCLGDDGSQGCDDAPGDPLLSPAGIAVSPDGESVYVTSADSSSLSQLAVQKPGGKLAWVGCVGNDASLGCADLPGAPLGLPRGVAVSPDGASVYTAASSGVAHFFRATPAGPGGGSGPGGGQPGGPNAIPAARFLSARLSNRVFAVDPKGAPEKVVSARAKKGTKFVYSLSKAARVLFRIERAAPGRKVGRSCRKPSRRNRRAKSCTRYAKVGAFAQNGLAGANVKTWSGKLGRRGLKPGSYRATLTAGNSAVATRRLSFTIVRG
jgi:DNA-binding beta-propeller fold protein YncE